LRITPNSANKSTYRVKSAQASANRRQESKVAMAEKVKKLGLKRDYTKYLYFLDKDGNVCQKAKSGDGKTEIVVKDAVDRDNQFLYFIDKEGDVSRSPRVTRSGKNKAA
jgi:hypothetical protein